MKSDLRGTSILAFLSVLVSTGCVSISIGPKKAARSEGVVLVEPGSPFKELKAPRADGAWQNPNNGNSISYITDCSDLSEPTEDSVSRELFSDISEMRKIRSEVVPYNNRNSVNMEIEGKVEGVSTRIQAVVFKKNGCFYTLTYVGVSNSFEENRESFHKFLKDFRAP